MNKEPEVSDINKAHELIKKYAHHTPVLTSESLNKITSAELYFKCENFQKVGAFKIRGGINSVFSLSEENVKKGVATHSSGNFAQALALTAKLKEVPAYIVMPRTAPQIKKNAVEGYGAKIYECEPTQQAREELLNRVVAETGAVFIHPYNDYDVIAGQATAAKELIEDTEKLDIIISPVGGGGLISGTALSAHYYSPGTKVIGAEPSGADDAYRSLRDNKIYTSINPSTFCDGLLTSLGNKTFPIVKKYVNEIITVSDNITLNAMRLIYERMKIVVEPSAAITLALVLNNPDKFNNKKIGLILSGGNVDLDNFKWGDYDKGGNIK